MDDFASLVPLEPWDRPRRACLLMVASSLLLIPISALVLFSANVPKAYCPMPTPLVIVEFLLAGSDLPHQPAVAVPSLVLMLWCLPYAWGSLVPPRRSAKAFVIVACLSALNFAFAWSFGVQYQGLHYTQIAALIDLLCAAGTAVALVLTRRSQSLPANLAANFMLAVYTFTYAFPYLGELP